ncbi:MAG: glutamate 5-kinase [Clostridiales bacterium]
MDQTKKLLVIKIGSSSLTMSDGSLAGSKIKNLVRQIAVLHQRGHSIVIVTSGSIAAGFRRLGFQERPITVPAKQAAAAVGQGLLMEEYTKYLLEEDCISAQILLTRGDFVDIRRYKNAFNALEVLLKRGVIPIINENDTISIEELKFGDNDQLSAQVAGLIHSDLLILLTDIDGLYTEDPRKNPQAQRIDYVKEIDSRIEALAGEAGSSNGTGGMKSKIEAAKLAVAAGVPVFICSSAEKDILLKAADGQGGGTYFQSSKGNLKTKLQWMAFYSNSKGSIHIDKGAVEAMEDGGKSLLPSGIISVDGDFESGDVIDVYSEDGRHIGRGISNFSGEDLANFQGLSSVDIQKVFHGNKNEAIHRDNWLSSRKIKISKRRRFNE